MARITPLSFLFALVTLLPLATTSPVQGIYKLTNTGSSGFVKTIHASGSLPSTSPVIVDDKSESNINNEYWDIEMFGDGYRIQNIGTGYWLTASDRKVVGASQFSQSAMWKVAIITDKVVIITALNTNLLMTSHQEKSSDTIVLEPDHESNYQKWFLEDRTP